jgi:hypothetical protein
VAITANAVIANGASLSGAVHIDRRLVTGILMPADWTTASLTFTGAAAKGGTHGVLKDSDGNELTVSAADDIFIALTSAEMDILSAPNEIKVRSGTSSAAVNQGAERTLTLVLK